VPVIAAMSLTHDALLCESQKVLRSLLSSKLIKVSFGKKLQLFILL
jgi:hypothetical protein